MRGALWLAIAIAAMLAWPWLDSEVLQNAAAGVVLVIALASIARIAMARKRSMALALPIVCAAALAFSLVARHEVAKVADAYAKGFIERHSCRPTFAELSEADEGWKLSHGPMLLKLRQFGAMRMISYQENGLLRFGFPYDDSRAVWLPECEAAQPELDQPLPLRL